MKIGEFAKACNMPLSVLRYYDSCGLLKPVYIDRFTGYRYYSENQITVCARINDLKAADFSLAEIKQLLSGSATPEDISAVFDRKKNRLNDMLRCLDKLREIISGGNIMSETKIKPMKENVHIPFENDEKIIGKWEIIGEYNNRTEFDLGKKLRTKTIGNKNREIFFLPNGEWYWCYSWTKGFVLRKWNHTACAYEIKNLSGTEYLFIEWKSGDYCWGGFDAKFYVFVRA